MGDIKINEKLIFSQTGSDEPVLASNVTFPAGHIVGVHHSGQNNANVDNAGTVHNSNSLNFPRVLASSSFIVIVSVNRTRSSTSGYLRVGYTRGIGSLSTTYVGQSSNQGEEDGTTWHNSAIVYRDLTTGTAGDNMYFGTSFVNTNASCSTRGAAIMVMEVVA